MQFNKSSQIIRRKPKIPNLDKVKFEIAEILKSGFKDFKIDINGDIEAYHDKLSKLFLEKVGLLLFTFIPSSSDQLKSKIYRVRKFQQGINLGLISEFSYCPSPLCTDFYRANYPRYPVFYSSPDPKTAIVEVFQNGFEANELLFLSEWSFRNGEKLNVTPFVFSDKLDNQDVSGFQKLMMENVINEFGGLEETELNSVREILIFFSDLFLYENTYKITSFLAHSHLYSDSGYQADIFMYPSVQTNYSTFNFAIHPNTVDHKMKLEKIYAVEVNNFLREDNRVTMNFIYKKIGVNHEGNIKWQDFNKQSVNEFNKFFE